ncbi:MAG TPA: hypothetical protein P5227_06405, partial [Emcibacteraceae bacterium]|nr:hypothetical protein [Emcibacteraceae bacterium]
MVERILDKNGVFRLTKEEIIYGFSQFKKEVDIGISEIDGFEYYYGFKERLFDDKNPENDNWLYYAYAFPRKPINTYDKLLRLNGWEMAYYEYRAKTTNYSESPFSRSSIEPKNYVSLMSDNIEPLNDENISDFIEVKHDTEDATLEDIVKIAKIPLLNFIDNKLSKLDKNKYEIIIDESVNFSNPDMRKYNNYIPESIDLITNKDSSREFQILYSSYFKKAE